MLDMNYFPPCAHLKKMGRVGTMVFLYEWFVTG